MGKIFRKIKDFCKRYIFKNKIISVAIGVVIVGILLFMIFGRTNVDSITKVKKILSNKFYKVECMNNTCDYVIAYKGEKLGKSDIVIYNAYGKKIASYKENFNSKEKYLKNIYSITSNYIIFKKTDILSGKNNGYILTTPKAKTKYSTDNQLSGINDFLISEKLDESYNVIDKNGKVLYTNASKIKSYANGKILSMTIKNEEVLLNEKGTVILNGYRIAKQVKDSDNNTIYLVLQDSNKNAYYYYDIIGNKIVGDAFNGYVDGSNKGELIITKKENNESVKYILKKGGKQEKLNSVSLDTLKKINSGVYDVVTESYIIPTQQLVLARDKKTSSFGVYNIKNDKFESLYSFKGESNHVSISKLLSTENDLYLQLSCSMEVCNENKMVIYDMVNDKKLYEMDNKDYRIQYFTNYGDYNVVKYSSNSSDEYKNKYAVYNKNNKEIFRSDNQIVIIDKKMIFGKEPSSDSLVLFSARSNKAINNSDSLANKIKIGKSYIYKFSESEKTYLYNSVGDKLKTINSSKVSLIYSTDTIIYIDKKKVFIINPTDNKTSTYTLKQNESINTIDGEGIPPYRNTLFINNSINNNIKVVNVNGRTIKAIKNSNIESVNYNKDSKNVIIITRQVNDNNNLYGLYIGK